MAENNDRI